MRLLYLMRSFRNKKHLLFFYLLLFLSTLQAQQSQNEETSVISLLKQVGKKYDVSFSYNKRDIKKIRCAIPGNLTSLEETLQHLTQNCGVKFFRIDARYIAVQLNANPPISICGTLIDTATGTPLYGASVVTANTQISTDPGGKFSIPSIPANGTISIYYLGFKVKELTAGELISEQACPLIFIDQKFNYLPTVLLNSYLTKGISKNAEGSISISNANFEILPSLIEPDVLRIAQILPGIESFNETASQINIRGGKSDEVLLLWDDIRIYLGGHFFGLISAFNPNLTQNVTIYKNGTHPRFGEGVSGVISMKSDSEIPEYVTGAASIDFISMQFYAKIPASENFAIHVSGRTSINTNLGNPVYNQFFNRIFQNTVVTNIQTNTSEGLRSTDEAFNFYDINVKGIWEISEKDRLQYNFLTISNKLQFTERFTGETFLSKNVSELKQRTLVNGLTWDRDWSTKFTSKVGYNSVEYLNQGANQNVDTGQIQSQENEVKESALKLDLYYTFLSNLSFNIGYQYTDTEILNALSPFEFNEVFTNRKVLFSNAFFVNSKWKVFGKKTIITAGIRYTNYPNISQQFYEPRINLFQKITPRISLTASAEMKHQAIIQTTDVQNNLLGIENQRWIILGANTSPFLENKQFSLGATFKKNNWNFSVEGFYKNIDGINSGDQGFRNQLIDVNTTGGYDVSGIEVSLSKKTDNLSAWISYTYMNNEYVFDELKPAKFRSNYDIKHTLSLAASYKWKSVLFSLGTTYHSGIPFTQVVTGNEIISNNGIAEINYDVPNNGTLKEFFRTDFSAGYTLQLDETFSGKVNLALFNILSRKNALDTYYSLEFEDGNPVINRIGQFSLGFTPNISLQLLF